MTIRCLQIVHLFQLLKNRFRSTSQTEIVPGPGSYLVKTDLSQNLKRIAKINKKMKGVIFGTSEKRNSPFNIEEKLPGPGQYDGTMSHTIENQSKVKSQESRNAYGRIIPKSSSMFLSTVKKGSAYLK